MTELERKEKAITATEFMQERCAAYYAPDKYAHYMGREVSQRRTSNDTAARREDEIIGC